jgi:putative tryptophan/tyrosine transport system substrate-binding protein
MKRRAFITLLGGAAALAPFVAHAQRKLPTIGYVGSAPRMGESQRDTALLQRLHELGWTEGRTIAIEYRWGENRLDRYADIAAEFVRLKVDAILTFGTVVPAAMKATSAIPIVFAIDADPVGRGFVASLARPGGNVTGLSLQSTDIVGKRLELLREVLPDLRRLAVMGNAGFPGAMQEMGEVAAAAPKLGFEMLPTEIRRAEDVGPAFEAMKERVDALYVCGDLLVFSNRIRINTLAAAARLPTLHATREFSEAGGLMSYGVNYVDMYRRAAGYVDKILRGAKPGDLPVEQPTKFELVVNLATAKALGLKIPESFLLRADEVIE